MAELVSIIITTKNEERNIDVCIRSILSQTYKNTEIIVVDNFSTDKTREISLKYTKNYFKKGPERSAQRNCGIEKARGKYVMYIDADMILSPVLIESCVYFIKQMNLIALHIPEIVLGKRYLSKVRRFERSFYNGTCIDGTRFFIKSSFIKAGGFDEKLSGPEDWDLDKKLKKIGDIGLLESGKNTHPLSTWELYSFVKKRGIDPNHYGAVIYHNESEFKLGSYLSKKGYYSRSFEPYIKKWGSKDNDIKKQFSFLYRYFFVFTENNKWVRLLQHPILSAGMYFLRFLVGMVFLFKK